MADLPQHTRGLQATGRTAGLVGFVLQHGTLENPRLDVLQAYALCYRNDGKDDDVELEVFGIQSFKRLESIEVALVEVCKQAKIDIESVKSFACIRDFQPLPDYADLELVGEYVVSFSGILDTSG